MDRAVGVVEESIARPEREAGDVFEVAVALEGPHERAKGQLALPAHDEVHPALWVGVGLGSQARIVATDDDSHSRAKRANELDDVERRPSLERHHGQPDEVGRPLADEALHGRPDLALGEDQVGDGDPVMGIQIAGERAERAVRHANPDRGHVLERVGHRDQKDIHAASPTRGGYPRIASLYSRSAAAARAAVHAFAERRTRRP